MWFCKNLQQEKNDVPIDVSHNFHSTLCNSKSVNTVTAIGKCGLPGSSKSSLLCRASGMLSVVTEAGVVSSLASGTDPWYSSKKSRAEQIR